MQGMINPTGDQQWLHTVCKVAASNIRVPIEAWFVNFPVAPRICTQANLQLKSRLNVRTAAAVVGLPPMLMTQLQDSVRDLL